MNITSGDIVDELELKLSNVNDRVCNAPPDSLSGDPAIFTFSLKLFLIKSEN